MVVPDVGLVAGNAGADLVDASLARLVGHLRIRDHCPRHAAHVGLACSQHTLGDLRLVDAPGYEHRQADCSAQGARLRRHIGMPYLHRRDDVNRAAEALHRAIGGVDVVDSAPCLQCLADGDHLILLETAGLHLLGRDAHAEDGAFALAGAYHCQKLGEEAQPVLEAAPVGVGAPIVARIEKVRDQEAVACKQLDAIEPCFAKAARGLASLGDDLLDQRQGHLTWHGVETLIGNDRGCVGDAAQAAGEPLRNSAGMGDLPEDFRTMAVDATGKVLQARDAVVAGNDQLGAVRKSGGMEAGRLHDDETGASLGPRLVIGNKVFSRQPALGEVGLVPGGKDAIADFRVA